MARPSFLSTLLCLLVLQACSSPPTSRERINAARDAAKPHLAADSMDNFWLDYRSPPDRDPNLWDFYYQNCTLVGRQPYTGKAEFNCLDGH
jgi:hypothetical protein